MQTSYSHEPFKRTRRAGAAVGAFLITFCFAGQAMALPFGKGKAAADEDAPEVVQKIKLPKDQQAEFDQSMKNGNAYLKQNNVALAQICFMRCVTLNPTSTEGHLGMAYCHAHLKKTEQAVTEVFESLKLDPNNIQARMLLGDLMMAETRWDEAGGQYLQILTQNPEDATARGNLATCMVMMGSIDAAIPHYQYILEKDPKNAQAAYNVAAVLEMKNQYDQAATYYKKVIELDPALADKKNVLIDKVRPQSINALCSMSKCLIANKKYQDSQELLNFAKKLKPDSYFVHLSQGYLFEVQNKTREAIEAYTRAVALNPKDGDSKKALERLLSNGGSSGKIKTADQIKGLQRNTTY